MNPVSMRVAIETRGIRRAAESCGKRRGLARRVVAARAPLPLVATRPAAPRARPPRQRHAHKTPHALPYALNSHVFN